MKNFLKGKFATVLIITLTFVLAGVAVFTAVRLYQLRNQSVAPNAPSSEPLAAGAPKSCTLFSFNLNVPTGTATATATPAPTGTSTASPTSAPTNSPTPAPTGTAGPTAQPALPNTGTDWPTITGAGIGILTILGSLLLAI